MSLGQLSSALALLLISCNLQSVRAYSAVDSYDTGASCYDCQYAAHDIHKEPRGPYVVNNYSGFHRCALEQEDDAVYVNKWLCQSERCFIRKDPNGQIYRGCADQWNLPWGVDTNLNCSQQGQGDAIWWFCDGHLCNDGFLHDSARCGDKVLDKEPSSQVQEEDEPLALSLFSADQPDREGGYYDYEQEVDPTPTSTYPTPVSYQEPTHKAEKPVEKHQGSSYQEPAEFVIDEETVHGIGFYDNFKDVEETMPLEPQAVYQNDPKPPRPQFHHVNSQIKQDSGSYTEHKETAVIHHNTNRYQGYGDVRPPKHHPSVYGQAGGYHTHQHPHTLDHKTPPYAPHLHTPNHKTAPHLHTPNHKTAPHPHTPNHKTAPHPYTPDHKTAPHPYTPDHKTAPHPYTPNHKAAPHLHTLGHGDAPHLHTLDHKTPRHPLDHKADPHTHKDHGTNPHLHTSDHGAAPHPVPHAHPPAHPHRPPPQQHQVVQVQREIKEEAANIATVLPPRAAILDGWDSHRDSVRKSHRGVFYGHGRIQGKTVKSFQGGGYVQEHTIPQKHEEESYNHETTTKAAKLPIFPHSHGGTPKAKSAALEYGYKGKEHGKGHLRIIDHGGLLPRSGKQNNAEHSVKYGNRRGGFRRGRYGFHTNHNREPFWMWWWHTGAFQRMNPQQAYRQYLYNRVMARKSTKETTYPLDDDVKNTKNNAGYRVQQMSYQRFPSGGRQRDYAPIRSNIYYSRITSKRRPMLPKPWAGGQKARRPVTKPHEHDTGKDPTKVYEGRPTNIAKTVDPLDYKSYKPLHTHAIPEPLGADHPDPDPQGQGQYNSGTAVEDKGTLQVLLDKHAERDVAGHGHEGDGGVTAKSLSKKTFYHYYDNLSLHQGGHRNAGIARGHVQSTDEMEYNPCGRDCSNVKSPGAPLYKDPMRADRFIQCGPGNLLGQACECCVPFYHNCPDGTTFDDVQKVCNQGGSSIVEDKDYKTLDLYADYK